MVTPMAELLHVEPPTDAQLGYLETLREQWEL
jgi:hypothetical protein